MERNKKILFVILVFLFPLIAKAHAEDIAIVLGADYSVYQQALEGFKANIGYSVKEYTMHNDIEEGKKIAQEIKKENPKLIFSIGNKATQVVKSEIENIPIIYALVINPSQYGLVGDNICGVSWEVSPLKEFEILKEIAPDAKKVGVIYNPETYQSLIKEAESLASGLGLKLISRSASSASEANSALSELLPEVQAFWMTADPLVANPEVFKKLVLETFLKGVVLFCPAENFVKEGAAFSFSINFSGSGTQAAEIAAKILEAKASCRDIGVERPAALDLFVNKKITDKLGISLSESLTKKITKTY